MPDQNTNFATKHTDFKTNKSTMAAHTDNMLKTKQEEMIKSSVVAPELTSPDLDPTLLFR
jgi:hypothetical protein